MFSDLYDSSSLLFSRSWPEAEGVITAGGVRAADRDGYYLVVEYKFSVGDDGPYTGESKCPLAYVGDATQLNEKVHVGEPITIRYRRDNLSVNKLENRMWEDFDGL